MYYKCISFHHSWSHVAWPILSLKLSIHSLNSWAFLCCPPLLSTSFLLHFPLLSKTQVSFVTLVDPLPDGWF